MTDRLTIAAQILTTWMAQGKTYSAGELLELPKRAVSWADALLAAEKPAAPATPALPWVVRDLATGHIYATCPTRTNADNIRAFLGESRCEVAPAAIVPVTFDANDAAVDSTTKGREWAAEIEDRLLTLRVCLRPGEDAGETTARMLAAVGRGP